MQEVYFGTVIFFYNKKGWGFIEWSKGDIKQKDMFFHYSDIQMEGFKYLKKEQKVSFSIGKNHHGDPKATNITII
jgi:CspA family cold shock protein